MYKLFIIIVLVFYSCSEKKDMFVTTLTASNSCWMLYQYPTEQINYEKPIIGGCTKFYTNYTFTPFVFDEEGSIEIHTLDKDASNKGEWNFSDDDSIFSVGGYVYKVLTFNYDTITLKNDKNHIQKMVRMAR